MSATITKARNGVWTPWAQILCVECDYAALKDTHSGRSYDRRLKVLTAMKRTKEVERPDDHLIATCDTCDCECWVDSEVALLQQVGHKSSELDWEGPFGWELRQTGGMCCALVFTTTDDKRQVVVTAIDGDFFVGEYDLTTDDGKEWNESVRKWQSESLYAGDELKDTAALDAMVDQCARKVIAFVREPAIGGQS